MTAILTTTAVILALAVVALWSHRRARLDHSDLDEWAGVPDVAEVDWDAEEASWRARVSRAEIALRVRDRLGSPVDGEDTFAATLAEVESLVRLS